MWVIHFIPKVINTIPNIKLVIMVCGESHFYNLYKLIKESDSLKMEPEFLETLLSIYDMAQSMGTPNLLITENGYIN